MSAAARRASPSEAVGAPVRGGRSQDCGETSVVISPPAFQGGEPFQVAQPNRDALLFESATARDGQDRNSRTVESRNRCSGRRTRDAAPAADAGLGGRPAAPSPVIVGRPRRRRPPLRLSWPPRREPDPSRRLPDPPPTIGQAGQAASLLTVLQSAVCAPRIVYPLEPAMSSSARTRKHQTGRGQHLSKLARVPKIARALSLHNGVVQYQIRFCCTKCPLYAAHGSISVIFSVLYMSIFRFIVSRS